jgi:hypothetical protein
MPELSFRSTREPVRVIGFLKKATIIIARAPCVVLCCIVFEAKFLRYSDRLLAFLLQSISV